MAKTKSARRRDAAEEVCWSLLTMINLGALDSMDSEWKKMLAQDLDEWAALVPDPDFHVDCA